MLKLYYHPLASFCWKALIALYERDTVFEPVIVDFGDAESSAAFRAVWPIAKMPVLRDEARNRTIAESTVVIEYLDAFYADGKHLFPADADGALQARLWDRIYDNYIHVPMQKIVGDRLRTEGTRDPFGVDQARQQLRRMYGFVEKEMQAKPWAAGNAFTLADCAAAPALFYADVVVPFGSEHEKVRAYLDRLTARPSFARVLREAEPYFNMFPLENKPRLPASVLDPAR